MGIFDKFIKFLGFEGGENKKAQKKVKESKPINAQYKLNKGETLENDKEEKKEEILKPSSQEDIQNVITKLKQEKELKVDLSALSDDIQRIMDFLCGAIFALDGEVISCEENIFIIKVGEVCED